MKTVTFHMNRNSKLTQLALLHRTWENGNTVFIYILYWKNEIVLFCKVYKVTSQNEAGGGADVLLTNFCLLRRLFFPPMILL